MKKNQLLLCICTLFMAHTAFCQNKKVIIEGQMNSLKDSDKVTLTIDPYGAPGFDDLRKTYVLPLVNHKFRFSVALPKSLSRFELIFTEKGDKRAYANLRLKLRVNSYIEQGQHLIITENNGMNIFSGSAAKNAIVAHEVNTQIKVPFEMVNPKNGLLFLKHSDSTFMAKLKYLKTKKRVLSPNVYDLLTADVLAYYYGKGLFFCWMTGDKLETAMELIKDYKAIKVDDYVNTSMFNKKKILMYSGSYTKFGILQQYLLDSCYKRGKTDLQLPKAYAYFSKHYTGALKERLLMNLLYLYKDLGIIMQPYINNTLAIATNQDFFPILNDLKRTRVKGVTAYNFTLKDVDGNTHRLSDYKGKVVVMDFWFTGCGACRESAPILDSIENVYKGKNVVFFSINTDRKKEEWLPAIASHQYTSDKTINLLTDGMALKHIVSIKYGVTAAPTYFIIGKEGKLSGNPVFPVLDNGQDLSYKIKQELDK